MRKRYHYISHPKTPSILSNPDRQPKYQDKDTQTDIDLFIQLVDEIVNNKTKDTLLEEILKKPFKPLRPLNPGREDPQVTPYDHSE